MKQKTPITKENRHEALGIFAFLIKEREPNTVKKRKPNAHKRTDIDA